ncbi:MAG TPA: hypothetical protein VL484_05525 [Vicinamibacterales bacterium]|jgi:hypothetical protein|nr:hypothetical protein [Vicinamibacterales bacterium]
MRFMAHGRTSKVVCAVALLLTTISCGSHHPTEPTSGGTGGPNQQPPPNNPPVINSISVQGSRAKEPANFGDVGETVNLVATVHDDETPVDQLQYSWSASLGTIDGTGSQVKWIAPAALPGSDPVDVTITLKVTETYGQAGGTQFEHDVSGTATLSLHDSMKEVGDMARQFLVDFSDSTITDVSYVMRNFDASCSGTVQETQQVSDNRKKFKIVRWNVGASSVKIPFGDSFCPVPDRVQRGDACASNPVHWESEVVGGGHFQIADGIDWIAAYYRPALKAWKLCDSQFTGTCVDTVTGGGCSDTQASSMVAGAWRAR